MLSLALSTALAAQAPVRLPQPTRFTKTATTQVLGTLLAGADVTPGRTSGAAMEVTFEGWIRAAALRTINRDGFTVALAAGRLDSLRRAPDGPAVATLSAGVGFVALETKDNWTRVRRNAWIPARLLTSAAPAPPAITGAVGEASLTRRTPLAATPTGAPIGSLDSAAAVHIVARTSGWTRIQLEAWVPDSAIRSNDVGALVGVSMAEVRANPPKYLGKVLEWPLQYVAVQKADELRPEIPEGRSYLLARGPLPEPGFVYVILPPDQVARFEALPPLKPLRLRGTLRSVSTKYLPTPVLELVSVEEGLSP